MGEIDIQEIQESVEGVRNDANALRLYLTGQIPNMIGFGLRVILALFLFWIGRKIIHVIKRLVRKSMEKANADQGVIQFTTSLVSFFLYAFLLINLGFGLGVEASSVAALLGTIGVTIGLALQGGLANIAGGIMLLMFKPFQVGDYIICNVEQGCEGVVSRIDICYTTLLSIDNKHIVIPNGTLSNSVLTNVTAQNMRRLEIKVPISYDSDIRKAKDLITQLLQEDPDTQSDQEIMVYVDELGDSAVVIGMRVWVATDRFWPTRWRMNESIKEAFDREGIKIPFQQIEIHMK